MVKRILLILALWVLFAGQAVAQEPTAAPDTPAAVQEVQDLPAATDQSGETSSGTENMTDIHDIKSLVAVPVPVSPALIAMWAGILILAFGAVVGGWYLWKKRKRPVVEEIEAMLSPEDAALLQLQALSPDTADGKAFYFQLSTILRGYLQGRFDIDGLEMTTEELLPHVDAMALERDMKRDMKQFLLACDPVKFAGAPTRRERMEQDLGFVRGIVEKTAASFEPDEETTGDPLVTSE